MTITARTPCAYVIALVAGAALFATTASALGTADDAKAMLAKTIAALKADKAKTLDEINKGENGFLNGDIYPFCFNLSDGVLVAVANQNAKQNLGKDIRENKDANGKAFGQELYDVGKEGGGKEVSYMFPKPGPDKTPAQKSSFVATAAGLVCGVGYYK